MFSVSVSSKFTSMKNENSALAVVASFELFFSLSLFLILIHLTLHKMTRVTSDHNLKPMIHEYKFFVPILNV